MAKLSNFLQPLCFGFAFLCCGMNFSLAEDCAVEPSMECDATLANKPIEERSFVFIRSMGVGYVCICDSDGGSPKWIDGWRIVNACKAGSVNMTVIPESTDKFLGNWGAYTFYYSIGGRAAKISGVIPDAYLAKDVCWGCDRGYYYYDNTEDKCKESEYPLPCDSNQNVGDTCIFNDGAKHAECQDIGMISNGYNVLTCNANECKDDYLLQLKPDGNSSGFCIKKSDAQKSCTGKCNGCNEECALKLHKNPNNNVENAAYIPGDCECKQETGCKLKFNDGTVLENIDTAIWYVDDTYINRTDGGLAEDKSLGTLVGVNDEKVNVGTINFETTNYVMFSCDGWGDDKVYFAFNCNDGYTGGNVIGRNDPFDMYDECIKEKTEEKPQQQTVKAAQTVTTQNDKQQEIAKAKKVLDDFYTYAKDDKNRSVWKDAEGNFNTARLASDLTAGVVLGTVGGVVSGVVIKKKQVEKGFDALHCTIGGQTIADWGDEFRVGFYQ